MFRHPATATLVFLVATTVLPVAIAPLAEAQTAVSRAPVAPLPTVEEMTQGLAASEGLLTFYQDRTRGKVWLRVPPSTVPDEGHTYLYVEGLTYGLGSNDVGLDRGQIGPARLVGIRRVGGRVLVEEKNMSYRALSKNYYERRSVRESFATSVLWGGEVVAQDKDGSVLVDFTSFLVRDAQLGGGDQGGGQGTFTLDTRAQHAGPRRVPRLPRQPRVRGAAHLRGDEAGPRGARDRARRRRRSRSSSTSRSCACPTPATRRARSIRARARSTILFADYAPPLAADVDARWHRAPPAARSCDPARRALARCSKPIVYYVDRGAPEPIRSALLEGASWWAKAFEAAGFIDAFRVELLPPRAPTRSTCATTSSSGCIARRAAGRTAAASSIRAPARCSRGT